MMLLIAFTELIGNCPEAVSADNITASAPSRTAVATSLVSALVGLGCVVILSSICVAMITGLQASLHLATIFFCQRGTFSMGTSTPKSPLATMMASVASIMESIFSSASGFSILATILHFLPALVIRSLRSIISSADLTNDKAIQSTSFSSPKARSSISFSVSEGAETRVLGRLIPFLDLRIPP